MDKKTENELKEKIAAIRRKLAEMRDYKRLIAADGGEPDRDDKVRETELIKKLLWLEKQLAGPKPRKAQKTKVSDPKRQAKTKVSSSKVSGRKSR